MILEKLSKNNIHKKYQILSNFSVKGGLPFFSIKNSRIMKSEKVIFILMKWKKEYLVKRYELRPNTIYSAYNYLYHNFSSVRTATVNTL